MRLSNVLHKPSETEKDLPNLTVQFMSKDVFENKNDIQNENRTICYAFELVVSNHPNSYFYEQIEWFPANDPILSFGN